MAKRVWVIDSDGKSTRQRKGWIAKHKGGEWVNGAYVFPPNSQPRVSVEASVPVPGAPGSRAATLFGQQWAQTEVRAAVCWYDPHGVMCFWKDQSNPGRVVEPPAVAL